MSGKRVTDRQVRRYMDSRKDGHTQAAETIGIRGLLVHALSPAAKRFCEARGFRESPANPITLLVILADARAAIDGLA